jgi:membrane protein
LETTVHTGNAESVSPEVKYGVVRQLRVLLRLGPRRFGDLLVQAYTEWSKDNAPRLGAALAYYALSSIAPVLIVVTGVAGIFLGQAAARGQIAPALERTVGPDGAAAVEVLLQRAASRGGGVLATVIGLVTLFLATSFLVNELRQSLNALWRVQQPPGEDTSLLATIRSMVGDRLYAFTIVIAAGLLLLLTMTVNTFVAAAGSYAESMLPMPEGLLQVVNLLVSFAMATLVFALVYKWVPDARVARGDVAVGALVTACLCSVGAFALSLFLGKTASASLYGTVGSVLVLLMWVYYTAQVFFFGAKVTRVFAERYGAHIVAKRRSLRIPVKRRRASRHRDPSGEH